MSYTIVLNNILLIVGLIGLNVILWKITSIEDIKNNSISFYYNWFLSGFIIFCVISNAIQAYNCTHNFVDIIGASLFTILSWMCFAIVIVYREYLRIPVSNVLGYLVYSRNIEYLVNDINKYIKCADPEKCPKDDERSVFEICTLLRSGKLFDLSILYLWPQLNNPEEVGLGESSRETNGILHITNPDLIRCINDLFMACYKRDLIGDIVLFSLTGVMCVFISEYIMSSYKCV